MLYRQMNMLNDWTYGKYSQTGERIRIVAAKDVYRTSQAIALQRILLNVAVDILYIVNRNKHICRLFAFEDSLSNFCKIEF